MGQPTLYGAPYSIFVRMVRIALELKAISYRQVPIDIFTESQETTDHLARHPFARIPVLDHDGFTLYETNAIIRYVDEAFTKSSLQPTHLQKRARMNQIISIMANYAVPAMVHDVYVNIRETRTGKSADPIRLEKGLATSRTVISALTPLLSEGPFLQGSKATLADISAAPIFGYFAQTEPGKEMMDADERLSAWFLFLQNETAFGFAFEPE